jgi:hypothetical protein
MNFVAIIKNRYVIIIHNYLLKIVFNKNTIFFEQYFPDFLQYIFLRIATKYNFIDYVQNHLQY